MALPLPSSPHWAPSTTLAGTVASGSTGGESMLWLMDRKISDDFRWEAIMNGRQVGRSAWLRGIQLQRLVC